MIDWPVLQIEPKINCAGNMDDETDREAQRREKERRKEIGCRHDENFNGYFLFDLILISIHKSNLLHAKHSTDWPLFGIMDTILL